VRRRFLNLYSTEHIHLGEVALSYTAEFMKILLHRVFMLAKAPKSTSKYIENKIYMLTPGVLSKVGFISS